MAEYSTPSQKKHSEEPSVFMTPSSSCGRPVYSAPKSYLTTPIPISPLTPLPTPKTKVDYEVKYCAVGEEHKDIITSLYEYGVPMLANRILSLLDPTETVRYVHESMTDFKCGFVLLSIHWIFCNFCCFGFKLVLFKYFMLFLSLSPVQLSTRLSILEHIHLTETRKHCQTIITYQVSECHR